MAEFLALLLNRFLARRVLIGEVDAGTSQAKFFPYQDEITMSALAAIYHGRLTLAEVGLSALGALRSRITNQFLTLCFVTIAAISALDTWLAVANSTIMFVEKNPVCLALMRLEPQGFTCFVAGKSLGTVMVLVCLLALHRYSYRHAKLVTVCVALFQVGLLTHLILSDPHFYGLPNFSLLFQQNTDSLWMLFDSTDFSKGFTCCEQ